MKVTIDDVAKAVGVSRSTVSRVLQGHANVDASTRDKVMNAINECNYHPSRLAQGFIAGKLNFIGLIIGDIRNPFYADIARAIEDAMYENGYMVVLCESDNDAERELKYLQQFSDYGFMGAVLTASTVTSNAEKQELERLLKRIEFPVVLINQSLERFEASVVSFDNHLGAYIAVEHLVRLGHRRIAILVGPENSSVSKERLCGWLDAFSDHGIQRPEEIYQGDLSMESGFAAAEKLLAIPAAERPTAICVGNDLMAQGIVECFWRNSLNVPQDMSVIGFGDRVHNMCWRVKLTTIQQPHVEMGYTAAKIMLMHLRGETDNNQKTIFEPKLIVRDSTCPPER